MILRILFIGMFFMLGHPAFAGDVAAIEAAAQNRFGAIQAQSTVGRGVVEWYRLRNAKDISFHDAKGFVTRYPEWPGLYQVREKAEAAINPSVSSREVIAWFQRFSPVTAKGMTDYLNALIAEKQTGQAMQVLKAWWPDATLTPAEQADILKKYGQYLGSQDNERRLRHIIHDKHYSASRDLARHLGGGYQQLVEAQIALIEQKPDVNTLIAAVPASMRNNEALMLARIQWRRKNDQDAGAIDLLYKAPAAGRLSNPQAWWQERHIMARRLMEQGKWGSAYDLVKNHKQTEGFSYAQAEFLAGWLALRKNGKPWEGFQHFEKLFNAVESPISRSRGAYWAGIASETLGHADVANQWYQVAAKYQTTFYGQMAAQRINLPLGLLSETPIQVTAEARNAFRSNNLIAAALLLRQAGQYRDAKLFLETYADHAVSGLDFKLSAELASSMGFNDAAVRIAKSAERQGYLMPSYLFPVLPQAKQDGYSAHPAFIHGIIRQESAFDQYAQSHAGALGLMQLMPATAQDTARGLKIGYSKDRLTRDPAYNMTLGSAYIGQMLGRFGGNRTLAIAAYNAGPGRVSRWIEEFGDPRDPNVDEGDWIETIPVYETRNYVQRVTEAVNVYARLIK